MPNRSRTPITPAASASAHNKSVPSKSQYLDDALAMGRLHSASLTQIDPGKARPRAAWRAIGYADAVLSFEHSPLLAELMREWEKGFDTALDSAPATAGATPVIENPEGNDANPYYRNPDRGPYELGHLLQQLPGDFGLTPAVELKHVQIASAAEAHAHVGGNTVLSGIEAIGHLMEAAGTSGEESMPAHTLFCLGGLLRHLAVEGQYLRGVGDSLAYAVALYGKRDLAICRKEARHG